MGKSRTDRRTAHKLVEKKAKRSKKDSLSYDPELAGVLLEQAQSSLSTGDLENALFTAQKATKCLRTPNVRSPSLEQLAAFEVLGAIHIEIGDPDAARASFELAAQVDPTGEYAGAEKFLWLAQLSEEGGQDTIQWFTKGVACLRSQLVKIQQAADAAMSEEVDGDEQEIAEEVIVVKDKLANALCGAAEVYMTDLSFDNDCEEKCEALVQEAVGVAPDSPMVLQTLANVRISQERVDEAKQILEKSVSLWEGRLKQLDTQSNDESRDDDEEQDTNDNSVPDFATRISLCRLLMEVDMCEPALRVLERLILEDDSSVEAWYLGGWCQHLIGSSNRIAKDQPQDALRGCRQWLETCLQAYEKQEYEDDRLRDHAVKLKSQVDQQIGPADANQSDDEEVDWEEERDDKMQDT